MKHLLIVFQTPSKNTKLLAESMLESALKYESDELKVVLKSPFETTPEDVINCDAIILGTTENLGYMSGALKDFFDRIYYPVLEVKQGLPMAVIIRAGHDGTGTKRAIETIAKGLRWRWVQQAVICKGEWDIDFVDQASELSEGMAVALQQGII